MHTYISKKTYWRTGVLLSYENDLNKALIKADLEEKKIELFISGNEPTRRVFLGIIREHLNHIHQTIAKIIPSEKIPYKNILIDYNHLVKLERLGEISYIPEGLEEKIDVKQILNGIKLQKETAMSNESNPLPNAPWWASLLSLAIIFLIAIVGTYFIGMYIVPILVFVLLLPAGLAVLEASRTDKLTGEEIVALAIESLKRFYLISLFRRDIDHQKPPKTNTNQPKPE